MLKRMIENVARKSGYKISKASAPKTFFDLLYTDLFPQEATENKRFYNVGAGSFFHPYWTNLDFASDWYYKHGLPDHVINYDLFDRNPFPIESDLAEVVYTSHVIEHIDNDSVKKLFSEAYRILKRGGVFRITCPDAYLHYLAYKNKDRFFCEKLFVDIDRPGSMLRDVVVPDVGLSIEQMLVSQFCTCRCVHYKDNELLMDPITDQDVQTLFIDNDFRSFMNHIVKENDNRKIVKNQRRKPGCHMNWWGREKVFSVLREVGFKEFYLSGYGQSRCPILRDTFLFDRTEPNLSLYVEAIK